MKFGPVWTDPFLTGALDRSAGLFFMWPAAKKYRKEGRSESVCGRSMIVFSRIAIIILAVVISSGKCLQYEFRKVIKNCWNNNGMLGDKKNKKLKLYRIRICYIIKLLL